MERTIIIIGGGPGGYVAAIRAAQLGAKVHLVEKTSLGGTCLNVGCIPTKALLHTANLFAEANSGAKYGISAESLTVDWTKAMRNKASVVKTLVSGVGGLLMANGVTVHNACGTLKDAKTVELSTGEVLTADNVILATGSSPTTIPFAGNDLPGVIDSTAALSLETLPKSICILGGGVIGCEFAVLFAELGVKVTILEMLPRLLPPVDAEIAEIVRNNLLRLGVDVHCCTKLVCVKTEEDGLCAYASANGEGLRFHCEKFLVSVGRRAYIDHLELKKVGVNVQRGIIEVDDNFETSLPGVFAIGDCNGKNMLAHTASAQGEYVAEYCMGHMACYNGKVVPSCVYTNPEVASVGINEEEAKSAGLTYRIGKFPLVGNGKALIENGGNGLVKIIVAEDNTILGAHMVGPGVTNMISEIVAVMNIGGHLEDITSAIHAHPTVSEAVVEAALAADGRAIHWPPRNQSN